MKEVSVYRMADKLVGFVVSLRDAISESLNPPEFEFLLTPIPHFERLHFDWEERNSMWKLEVKVYD